MDERFSWLLFEHYFQPHISKAKTNVFQRLVAEGRNIIIPDTAVSATFSLSGGKVGKWIRFLKKHGYKVVMTAVVASKGPFAHGRSCSGYGYAVFPELYSGH